MIFIISHLIDFASNLIFWSSKSRDLKFSTFSLSFIVLFLLSLEIKRILLISNNTDRTIKLSEKVSKFKADLLEDQKKRLKEKSIDCEVISIKDLKNITEEVYALYPSIGENLDFIRNNKLKNIKFLYRKLDQFSWQYCNKGFFNFKNYIPKIIANFN